MTFVRVASLDDLWEGEMLGLRVQRTKLLLVHVNQTVCAYEDRCAHQAVEMSKGRLSGTTLICQAHEWAYDACTGLGMNPLNVRLRPFPVRVEGSEIWVDLEPG